MNDRDCVAFLQWCLLSLGMRWAGFRKVRKQVCKKISRRMNELGVGDVKAYRSYLISHKDEWTTLGSLCRVTISRFYRDRGVFDRLRSDLLPSAAGAAASRGASRVRIWSAGCASGEEPYTLAIIWGSDHPCSVGLEVIATDADPRMLERAREGRYNKSSLKDLPDGLRKRAFTEADGAIVIKDAIKRAVDFQLGDIREEPPPGVFDLIFCRNLAFTYYDEFGQAAVLEAVRKSLIPGGYLVIGVHERLPGSGVDFELCSNITGAYKYWPRGCGGA